MTTGTNTVTMTNCTLTTDSTEWQRHLAATLADAANAFAVTNEAILATLDAWVAVGTPDKPAAIRARRPDPDPPSTHTEVADWLEGTLAYLRLQGWTKGAYVDFEGRVCLEGAVFRRKVQQSDMNLPIMRAAKTALVGQLYRRMHFGVCITGWNDDGERTLPEVEALLQDTIDWERKAAAEAGEL